MDGLSKYCKPAKAIKTIKLPWLEKLCTYEMEAYSDKDNCKLRDDNAWLELLQFLRNQPILGPFSNADAIKNFMDSVDESQAKNLHFYKEVRYARMTSTALPRNASFFRLHRNHKKLTSQEYADILIGYLDRH
jgi:hypothetical protein